MYSLILEKEEEGERGTLIGGLCTCLNQGLNPQLFGVWMMFQEAPNQVNEDAS